MSFSRLLGLRHAGEGRGLRKEEVALLDEVLAELACMCCILIWLLSVVMKMSGVKWLDEMQLCPARRIKPSHPYRGGA